MMRALVAGLVVAAAAAWFYAGDLDRAPAYLYHDEVSFARHAHELATTGRGLAGTRFPVYFQEPGFSVGRDPIYIYATAAALRVLPWDDTTLRVVTVGAALVSIVLAAVIGTEVFGSLAGGLVAALLLTVSPAFLIHARQALCVLLPVPFIAWWLLFLVRYLRTGSAADLALATAGITAGLYTYLAMAVLLPIYLLTTFGAVLWRRSYRHAAVLIACVAIVAVPFGYWQLTHPGRFGEAVAGYKLYDPSLDALHGARDLLSWFSIGVRADVYWQAFNPGRLFFTGESSLLDSTRQAGTFPLAALWLLPIGFAAMLRAPLWPRSIVLLIGFVTAPLPSVILGNANLYRYLGFLLFGSIVSAAGVWQLWTWRAMWARALAVFSIVLSAWLFVPFHRFYLNEWPVMSSPYQGGNIRGALDAVLLEPAANAPPQIYLSTRITYIEDYFDLYARLRKRNDLRSRGRVLDITKEDWRQTETGSVAIVLGSDPPTIEALKSAAWQAQQEIKGLDGRTEFVIFRRQP